MHAARILVLRDAAKAPPCLDETLLEAGLTVHFAPIDELSLHLAAAADVVVVIGCVPAEALTCLRQANPAPMLLLVTDLPTEADLHLSGHATATEVLSGVRVLLRLHRELAARRASDNRLQNILDNAPLCVSIKDPDGRYVLVNRSWEHIFQRDRQAVLGKTAHDVFPPVKADQLAERSRAALTSPVALEDEETTEQPDGPHTYVKTMFALAEDAMPFAVCAIALDITERKKAEQELRDSRALYHSLVETLPVCIFRKDLNGRFTFVNTAFAAELHHAPSALLGKSDRDLYPADLAAKYADDDRQVTVSGVTFECIEENRNPLGDRRVVQVIKSPLRDASGRIIGLQGIYWDVTARRLAEEELARKAADLAVAQKVQQQLYPSPHSLLVRQAAAVGIDIGGISIPADEIGGDYYDYFSLGEGSLGLIVADVSGHGVGPALLMGVARAYLRAVSRTCHDPGEMLARVNELLADDIEGDRFITMALARLDLRQRTLVYASAGHATCFILAGDGAIKKTLPSTGVPLGIIPPGRCETSAPIPLEPGDLILLVTDGIVEAPDPQQQLFTAQRVLSLVRVYRHASARQIAENLYHAVRAFGHNLKQTDDKTALVIKVGPAPGGQHDAPAET